MQGKHGATAAVAATCTRSGRAARRVRHLLSAIRYLLEAILLVSSVHRTPSSNQSCGQL